jgi:hypothetical protein
LPLSVCYLYVAYLGHTYYSANSFNMTLLVTNGLTMFLNSVATLFSLIMVVKVIKADESELKSAVSLELISYKVQWWIILVTYICYWVTHWIFAFKYWTLALKV